MPYGSGNDVPPEEGAEQPLPFGATEDRSDLVQRHLESEFRGMLCYAERILTATTKHRLALGATRVTQVFVLLGTLITEASVDVKRSSFLVLLAVTAISAVVAIEILILRPLQRVFRRDEQVLIACSGMLREQLALLSIEFSWGATETEFYSQRLRRLPVVPSMGELR
jgi:hypothetical protein